MEGEEGVSTPSVRVSDLVVDGTFAFLADPSRLPQVFENLLRNAADHAGDEDGPATVTVGPLEDDDGFYVADDGPGIPADRRERVFQHGFTDSVDGPGFGLAIVESVVEAHGWSIAAVESVDGGARFEVHGVEAVGR
jgi:signal transduction histidine kinase